MVTFRNGPAAGVSLALRRVPYMLRVTRGGSQWDALDQIDDVPRPGEAIYVYYCVTAKPGYAHYSCSPRSKSFSTAIADYEFLPDQPADADVRTNAAWAAWCEANRDRLLALTPGARVE